MFRNVLCIERRAVFTDVMDSVCVCADRGEDPAAGPVSGGSHQEPGAPPQTAPTEPGGSGDSTHASDLVLCDCAVKHGVLFSWCLILIL